MLPTSEIGDLHKEQREMRDAETRQFGLVGRQTNIHLETTKAKPVLQKFFEDKQHQEIKTPPNV